MTVIEDVLAQAHQTIDASRSREDPDRPLFHLAPPVGRLNDPNGLVVVDGVHHAFFQFGPFFPERKAIFWGHASSEDLLTWHHHAPAIAPDSTYDHTGAYSGGAYAYDDTVWLHYTGNVKEDGVRTSTQCAVTTTDLVEFTKHPANPLLPGPPPGYTAHFRDPAVFAHDEAGYRMCVGAQRDDLTGCVLLYRSPDLASWELEGELRFAGADLADFGFMWECPTIIRVPEEATGELRDVLIFCPQGVGPDGEYFRNVFPCGYLVGELVGDEFRVERPFAELDRGFEFYAPQTFHRPAGDDGDPAPTLLGWLGNAGEDDQPSLEAYGWVHTMSIARRLTLRDGHLYQRPIVDAGSPRATSVDVVVPGSRVRDGAIQVAELTGRDAYVLHLEVDQSGAAAWSLVLASGDSRVDLRFEPGRLTVDRSRTRYPHGERRTISVPAGALLTVDLVHDRSVTEVFVADGHTVFSLRSFLEPGDLSTTIAADGTLDLRAASAVLVH